jgi:phage replication initiation protein
MRTAIIDWLSFTLPVSTFVNVPDDPTNLIKSWLTDTNIAEDSRGSRNYYKYSRQWYAVSLGEIVPLGFFAWGGQRNTANIVLNGQGCSLVKDWSKVRDFMIAHDARISRVDTAVDFLDGEFTVDIARDRYLAGDFNINNRPSHKLIGPWLHDVQGNGRTIEIGKRVNGKMCRVYEKGKQLKNLDSLWNRCEVELHNRDRVIPLDIVTNPTVYFAGSYPFFQELLKLPDSCRISTFQNEWNISVEAYTLNLKRCYGKTVDTIRKTYKTDTEFVNALCVAGIPKRLHKPSLKLLRNDKLELIDINSEDNQAWAKKVLANR